MRFYEASAIIAATPAEVWEVLTDGPGLTSWDSGIERFEGRIMPGSKIKLHAEVSPGRAFSLRVIAFEPPTKMVWRGGMPFGLFRGERTYGLRSVPEGTEFRMREEFTGALGPMIWKSMPDLGPSFTRFAEGLKAHVEDMQKEGTA